MVRLRKLVVKGLRLGDNHEAPFLLLHCAKASMSVIYNNLWCHLADTLPFVAQKMLPLCHKIYEGHDALFQATVSQTA